MPDGFVFFPANLSSVCHLKFFACESETDNLPLDM